MIKKLFVCCTFVCATSHFIVGMSNESSNMTSNIIELPTNFLESEIFKEQIKKANENSDVEEQPIDVEETPITVKKQHPIKKSTAYCLLGTSALLSTIYWCMGSYLFFKEIF